MSHFVYSGEPWFDRGGYAGDDFSIVNPANPFSSGYYTCVDDTNDGTRSVLLAWPTS